MKGSVFFATVPMEELSVGTVRQANTDIPNSSAKAANFDSDSWWWSLSRKKIPVAYFPKGGKSMFCSSLETRGESGYHSRILCLLLK